jgi:hypothetical protein
VQAWLALAVLGCAGCAGDSPDPFGFLDIRLEAARPEGELRAAIMWADHGRGGVLVTDDQPVPFETAFEFSLRRLPPDDALRMVSNVDGPMTRGRVVAYLDRDGDGSFDWTSVLASEFRDEIVGWAAGIDLVYTPNPSETSVYQKGLNLEVSPEALVPLDTELTLHVFAVEQTRCFGMKPPPRSAPDSVFALVIGLAPTPWPYSVGVGACEGDELPRDWWGLDCYGPGSYLVTTVQWPADENIAALCGWSADYCEYRVPDGAEPPPELPSCN